MASLEHRLQVATATMARAAPLALDLFHRRSQFALEEKSANEFVSEADRQVESYIRACIATALPDDIVMGEEMGGAAGDAFWSIDPIDGTANFLRGSPLWGVSIGYVAGGRSQIGVICFPALDVVLSAALGLGVWHQGHPYTRQVPFSGVRVASVGDSSRWSIEGIAAVEGALRRAGWGVAEYRCATIGLGFAALGYTDGYIEQSLSVWDLAAGAIICEQAGLVVEYGGSPDAGGMWIRAATPEVHHITRPYVPVRQLS